MPAPLVRKAIWAALAGCIAVVLVLASLPLIASTQIVRTRIAQELSARTGYRVTLGEAPDLVLWPSLRAVLNNVSFSSWEGDGRTPVLETERLEARLSAWRALVGTIDFSAVTLVRPVLRVEADGSGFGPPRLPGDNLLISMLKAADSGTIVDGPAFGTVRFSGGRVVEAQSGEDLATDLAGLAEWRMTGSPALFNGTGVWRGETVKYALVIEAPMKLAAREASPVTVSFEADPARASFTGEVSRREGFAFDGQFTASSPSVRRALEWSRADIAPGTSIGPVSLSGKATGDGARLKLADARLSLDDNPGSGALEFDFSGLLPSVSGTLAFDTLDLGNFLAAFDGPVDPASPPPVFDLSFTDQINLDLRLSATRATGAGIQLTDVAATAQARTGFAAFDVSDATAFGGEIQAGFRVDRKEIGEIGEMRISAEGVDWSELSKRFGWTGNEVRARGMLNLVMRSPIADLASLPRTVEGTITAKLEAGSLAEFDLAKLMAQQPGAGFFPLSALGGGTLAFEGAEFKATLGNGVARIDTAKAWTQQQTIRVDGIVPYVGRSLALSVKVEERAPAAGGAPQPDVVSYFVGGSWGSPYFSALIATIDP